MYHQFSNDDVENILRSSEGRPTRYRDSGAIGHPGLQHLLLSNADLLKRYEKESEKLIWANGRWRHREQTWITAFCSLADMVDAAQRVLNAAQTQAALADFFRSTPREPGMRADIAYHGDKAYKMRYVQGLEVVRTFPADDLIMILDRVDERPFGLHIQTFFGTFADQPRNTATIFSANGHPRHSHFAP